jgi:hypothetical protein
MLSPNPTLLKAARNLPDSAVDHRGDIPALLVRRAEMERQHTAASQAYSKTKIVLDGLPSRRQALDAEIDRVEQSRADAAVLGLFGGDQKEFDSLCFTHAKLLRARLMIDLGTTFVEALLKTQGDAIRMRARGVEGVDDELNAAREGEKIALTVERAEASGA